MSERSLCDWCRHTKAAHTGDYIKSYDESTGDAEEIFYHEACTRLDCGCEGFEPCGADAPSPAKEQG